MSKSNRMYKIFMTTMIVIIAGLLLATGIIAIQKQMKLKANIEFLPGINVEIFVKNDDNPTETLIFRNFEDTANSKAIEFNSTYCELSATTLTFNNAFVTAYGNNFTLIVKNYSDFTIQTEITSTSTAIIGGNSVEAVEPEITPPTAQIESNASGEFVVSCEPIIPQETILTLQFEEVPPVDVTVNFTFDGATDRAGSSLYFIVVITNDPGFEMTTCAYVGGGGYVYYPIWKSSYDSKYYCYSQSVTDEDGVTYAKATLEEGIKDNYKGYDYIEQTTDPININEQEFVFKDVSVGSKVYIYSSVEGAMRTILNIKSVTITDVEYNFRTSSWGGLRDLDFVVPDKNVNITINGTYLSSL